MYIDDNDLFDLDALNAALEREKALALKQAQAQAQKKYGSMWADIYQRLMQSLAEGRNEDLEEIVLRSWDNLQRNELKKLSYWIDLRLSAVDDVWEDLVRLDMLKSWFTTRLTDEILEEYWELQYDRAH